MSKIGQHLSKLWTNVVVAQRFWLTKLNGRYVLMHIMYVARVCFAVFNADAVKSVWQAFENYVTVWCYLEARTLLKSDLSSVDFVTVRFLMKLLNTTNIDIINNCRQYLDVKLPILSGLIVSEGLRKSSPTVTIFFLQNFSLNSIAYRPIYLLVKFLFCLFCCFLCWCCQKCLAGLWELCHCVLLLFTMCFIPLYIICLCPSFCLVGE